MAKHIKITEHMIKRAAVAIAHEGVTEPFWDIAGPAVQNKFIAEARAALEAALEGNK